MPVQFKSAGVVLFSSLGNVAMAAGCCCEQPCECSLSTTTRKAVDCDCIDAAYGTPRPLPDAYITIGGTTPTYVPRAFPFTCSGPQDVSACNSIAGIYGPISCGEEQSFCANLRFVCTFWNGFASRDQWTHTLVTISYADGVINAFVRSRIVDLPAGSPTPICFGAGAPAWQTSQTSTWSWVIAEVDDWEFNLNSTCRAECNFVVKNRLCPDTGGFASSGSVIASPLAPGTGACDISGATASVSF